MSALRYTLADTLDVAFGIVQTNVDQLNNKPLPLRRLHGRKRAVARERRFDGEAFAILYAFPSAANHFAAC